MNTNQFYDRMITLERLGVLLNPREGNFAKFNAGMVRIDDKVHMLYRWSETGKSEIWWLPYVQDYISHAELTLDGKLVKDDDCVFIGSTCLDDSLAIQDPRIVPFEDHYYIFYTAIGHEQPGYAVHIRVGVARTRDFKNVEKLGVIPTDEMDKDAFIFPERVNGKIVYIHRIEPDIQIEYFDRIEDLFDREYWKNYSSRKHDKILIKSQFPWEDKKVGGSVPPIKTDAGWLLIYHGVASDGVPFVYRMGAALLDLHDPSKVVARLPYPVMEPVEDYELFGDVNNVVFPQGAYINDGWLYISYGAADKRVAMARLRYDELMEELLKNTI